jgi:predicted dienelactone hydrolase
VASALLSAVLALALAGSGLASAAPARRVAKRPQTGDRGAGLARCVFVDPTRSTFDYATGVEEAGRTLVTEIRFPARGRGPFPTIFFAPGYALGPGSYAALLEAWVEAGFVVIAPIFPDTNPTAVAAARTGDPEDDVANQPADLAFVIRRSLAASATATPNCRILEGLINRRELGVAGQSDGGDTVAMLGFDANAAEASLDAGLGLRAAAVLSGAEFAAGPYEARPGDPALLVVQSTADACNPPEDAATLYDAIVQPDKWYLDLFGADHLPPYDGADPPAFRVVAQVTTRFFLLELAGKRPGAGFLAFGDRAPAVARLTSGAAAPAAPDLDPDPAVCYSY